MSFRASSFAILVAIATITLALVTAASFTHYSAFAVSKKDDSSSSTTTKATSATSAATNSNSLTSKELKSFINCVTTANKAQGLTHKVVRSCLDTALGIPAASGAGTAAAAAAGSGASSAGSSTSDTTG
jgi:hypothetical protein